MEGILILLENHSASLIKSPDGSSVVAHTSARAENSDHMALKHLVLWDFTIAVRSFSYEHQIKAFKAEQELRMP